jgi:hypothetical protein
MLLLLKPLSGFMSPKTPIYKMNLKGVIVGGGFTASQLYSSIALATSQGILCLQWICLFKV